MLRRLIRGILGAPAQDVRHDVPAAPHPAYIPAPAQETPAAAVPAPLALPFMIRPATADDLPGLLQVFRASVRTLAVRDYDADQLAAWSGKADDGTFLEGLRAGVTILAEHHGEPVAFAQLEPVDCVRMLYVHPDWAGLGIATLLCQYLEDEARIGGSRQLQTHASHTAKRFFESMGYRAQEEETVRIGNVSLGRTRMCKQLGA